MAVVGEMSDGGASEYASLSRSACGLEATSVFTTQLNGRRCSLELTEGVNRRS